jgi:hypothetical protein
MKRPTTGLPELLLTQSERIGPFLPLILLLSSFLLGGSVARANVYATNIRLNGGATNLALPAGTNLAISYILNEPATAGLAIDIASGATTVRSISLTNGAPGTARGTNTVVWDGMDSFGQNPASGAYVVRITAAATGYTDWTQTSFDTNAGNYVWEPRGIAVNKNANSVFYGRVFVANAAPGGNPDSNPGDAVGMQKLNADGSYADDGAFSTGGYPWSGQALSPWKVEVASDDRLYVNDFIASGIVLSFDQTISSNSLRAVLRTDNYPNNNVNLDGPFVSGSGTNLQIWMADASSPSVGVRRWDLTPSGVIASNDVGATIIQAGPDSDVSQFPEDMALDQSNHIYTIQRLEDSNDPDYRLFRFPPYSGTNETLAEWKVGGGDNTLAGANGVAVDPTGTYVAVACIGVFNSITSDHENGAVRVFAASNGAPVVTLTPGEVPSHPHWDTAWDNVGNLYAVENQDSTWRVYSPPGSNQATTVAIPIVQIIGAGPANPTLSSPVYSNGFVHFTLFGESNVTYIIQASTDLVNWVSVATNTSVLAARQITLPAPSGVSYYRAVVATFVPAPPVLSAPALSAGQFQFTLLGQANLTYIIEASADLRAWVPVATNSSPAATRSISVPAVGNPGFFRARVAH